MYQSNYYSSDYYASLYYGIQQGDEADITAFSKLAFYDVKYEALKIATGLASDLDNMEKEYWLTLFSGRRKYTIPELKYEGIKLGLGFRDYKDYFDSQTTTTWPDVNTSEKAYWLKVIVDNI